MTTPSPKAFRLAKQQFSKRRHNIVMSELDLAGLEALNALGGKVGNGAALAKELANGVGENSRASMIGGRLLRRLERFGFVRPINDSVGGFEITLTGKLAADQAARAQ